MVEASGAREAPPSPVTRRGAGAGSGAARSTLFALTLGVAALFHLAGNPRFGFVSSGVALSVVQVAVGAAAVTVCLGPRRQAPLLALCALLPLSAWLEAPTVGNHWVLAAFLALAYLCAWAVTRVSGAAEGPQTFAAFHSSGRLVLLIAYAFAAFAKLNTDFFDPLHSCAVFYQDQLVGSWGLDGLSVGGRSSAGVAVAVLAAGIELSVPVLLAFRRTRRAGVLLGLSFHWLLALDLDQHFWDFSSVLFVGFLLFLDDGQVGALAAGARRLWHQVRPAVRVAATACAVLAAAVATGAAALPDAVRLHELATSTGHLAWLLIGTGLLVGVWAATAASAPDPVRLSVPRPALWLVPVLVALNGLTPYLELKTGFGWQMYSNLRTVDGETNHLVVPSTIDLTGLQADRVEILASSDPWLEALVGHEYEVVFSELQEYARENPGTTLAYRRDGVGHGPVRAGADPDLAGGSGPLSTRLQSFRVVDASGSERCLATFTPAR